jgi:hypothetical protein
MDGRAVCDTLDTSLWVLLASLVSCLLSYWYQRRALAAFVRQVIAGPVRQEIEAVFQIANYIFSNISRGPDPCLFPRALRSLGASPMAILRRGGCCSGLHRLYIASLDTIGIRSAQITLYTLGGSARHCVSQVMTAAGPHIIDVQYGVHYRSPEGGALGLAELARGVLPQIQGYPCGCGQHASRVAGYPPGDYHAYDFTQTRSANWTRSWRRRVLYKLLRLLTVGRIDHALFPPILEWPQILFALAVLPIAFALLLLRLTLPA